MEPCYRAGRQLSWFSTLLKTSFSLLKPFLGEDFLLQTATAQRLYHEFAASMPIIDYHCHLPPEQIAVNHKFENITKIWLDGDHYKWRAMRAFGVNENEITGSATDATKFRRWAETVPYTLRNPLYHWTHMELRNPFGITDILNGDNADAIYAQATEKLQDDCFSTQGLLKHFNVKVVGTTDDPLEDLSHHKAIANQGFDTKVLPSFRPDKLLNIEDKAFYDDYLQKLEVVVQAPIETFDALISAIEQRVDYFHENGCRLSDHGLEFFPDGWASDTTARAVFEQHKLGKALNAQQIADFQMTVLHHLGTMYAARGWVQQFHLGAIRNNNSRLKARLGADTGFDSIGDFPMARTMVRYFDGLDREDKLAKTILYNLNPRDNELFATMCGNYNDGSVTAKFQFGSGWWFLDQKDGMERQMNALSNLGLLSKFVGMLTDSRSFLSYSRHEYFRRILCNLFGNDIENGELPNDMNLVGGIIQDICYNNAAAYFDFGLKKNE